jgi:NAD(P)-dependent dehydrogenase (short-subunit alcohol dehydrogenase family)
MAGRTVLVTGASLGLGYAMARGFAATGARVAMFARRPGPLLEARERIVSETGAEVATEACDVADADALERAFRSVTASLGPVDVLVNNAGRAATGPFVSLTDEDWQADFDLKLFAAIRLTRAVWPQMVQQRFGRIINILNTAAKAPPPNSAPTSVTRAAGMALTKVLAGEGAPHNVLVNAILIGFLESDQIRRQHDASDGSLTFEEFIARSGKRLPMGRMGKAEDCAKLALFLASDAADYLTGCAINLDGGLSPVP